MMIMTKKTTTTAAGFVVFASLTLAQTATAAFVAGAGAGAGGGDDQSIEYLLQFPDQKFGTNFEYVDSTSTSPKFFRPPTPRNEPGYSYQDDIAIEVVATLDDSNDMLAMMGMMIPGGTGNNQEALRVSWGMYASIDSTTKLATTNPSNLETDVTVKQLEMDLDALMFQMHCAKTTQKLIAAPECTDLLRLVGEMETIVTDRSTGDLVSVKTFEGIELTAQQLEQLQQVQPTNSNQEGNSNAVPSTSLEGKFQAQQFAASSHYAKHSDLLKFLPDHPVKPGDTWADHIDMIDTMGVVFTGTSALQGYYPCSLSISDGTIDAHDCAIFTMDGIAHVDEEWLASTMMANTGDSNTDWLQISDATVFNTFVWDVADEIPRWIQSNITLTLTLQMDDSDMMMMNGMGIPPPTGSGGGDDTDESKNSITLPIQLIFQLSSDITGKSTSGGDGGGTVSSTSPMSSATDSRSSSSSSLFVWLVTLALVGGIGFFVYKRQYPTTQYSAPPRRLYDGVWESAGSEDDSSATGHYESPPPNAGENVLL